MAIYEGSDYGPVTSQQHKARVDPKLRLIGMCQRIKNIAGPACGLSIQSFPKSQNMLTRWRKIYDLAKELQDDITPSKS